MFFPVPRPRPGMADTDGDDVEGDGEWGRRGDEDGPARDGEDGTMDGEDGTVDDDADGSLDAADLLGSRLEPGSPSLENAAFVMLGMVAAVVVWLLLLP